MVLAIVRASLGPLAFILDFIIEKPLIVAAIMAVYLGIYMAGYFQLRNIKNKTTLMVIEMSQQELKKKPNITSGGLYKRIYPAWEKEIKSWGWFIPHRLDLWPVLVTPENLQQKMSFTPQWIANLLKKNNILLTENESQTEK
jgi:hypothetical protein